jgi:hypothetical protein
MIEDETKKYLKPFEPPEFFKKFMSGMKQGNLEDAVKLTRGIPDENKSAEPVAVELQK